MNNTHTHTMDNQTTNSYATLTALQQDVLADILAEASRIKAEGRSVICWANAFTFGKVKESKKYASFAAGIASLVRKGVIETAWTKEVTAINPLYLPSEVVAEEVAVEVPAAEEVAEVELVECTEEEKQKLAEIAEYERQINELKRKVEALKKELNADDDTNPEPPSGGAPVSVEDAVIAIEEDVDTILRQSANLRGETRVIVKDNFSDDVYYFVDVTTGKLSHSDFIAAYNEFKAIWGEPGLDFVEGRDYVTFKLTLSHLDLFGTNPEPPSGGAPVSVEDVVKAIEQELEARDKAIEATKQGKLNKYLYCLNDLHAYYKLCKANKDNPTGDRYEAMYAWTEAYPEFASLSIEDMEVILYDKEI